MRRQAPALLRARVRAPRSSHLRLALLAATILTLSVWTPAQAHAFTFTGPTNYAVGSAPQAIAVADYNGDADPDLAVVNEFSPDVGVLLGGAGGTFGPQTTYTVGSRPLAIAAGDFNGDSDPDLAVVNEHDFNVSILVGGSGGSFTGPTNYAVGTSPQSVAVGNFNGDSDPDLAVANGDTNDISVLIGGAGATFGAPINFPVGASFPMSVEVADFNGDSDPDLATANELSNNVSVLLGTAGVGFAAPVIFPVGAAPRSIAVGNFNGDSDPDLATSNELSHDVSVLLGGAGGSFSAAANYPANILPDSITVGDFNRDLDPDLAVANQGTDDLSVLFGGAGGTFSAPTNFPAGDGPTAVAVGDFNANLWPDVVVANELSNTVSVFLGAPAADLSIAMTDSPDPVSVGSDLTYAMNVANAGPTSAASVRVTDPLPAGVTYQSATPSQGSCSQSAGVVTCNLGTLASSGTATVQVVVRPQSHGDITNTASVSILSAEADPNPGNNSAQVVTSAIVTNFPRPGGATPLRVPLVPEFQQCLSPNASHIAPLNQGSCTSPQLQSSLLTTSSTGRGSASARLDALTGDPGTPADEADVRITASASDVKRTADGADYVGSLVLATGYRVTDRANGPSQLAAATVADGELTVPFTCTATADPAVGAACSVSTTLDSVVPGFVKEGKRMILSAFSIKLLDAGPDGSLTPPAGACPPTCGSGDESTYLRQGVFTP